MRRTISTFGLRQKRHPVHPVPRWSLQATQPSSPYRNRRSASQPQTAAVPYKWWIYPSGWLKNNVSFGIEWDMWLKNSVVFRMTDKYFSQNFPCLRVRTTSWEILIFRHVWDNLWRHAIGYGVAIFRTSSHCRENSVYFFKISDLGDCVRKRLWHSLSL